MTLKDWRCCLVHRMLPCVCEALDRSTAPNKPDTVALLRPALRRLEAGGWGI